MAVSVVSIRVVSQMRGLVVFVVMVVGCFGCFFVAVLFVFLGLLVFFWGLGCKGRVFWGIVGCFLLLFFVVGLILFVFCGWVL